MKTVGIICEYNPFHLGHLRQINLIRDTFGEDTAIVCVMSGNYVQRGEPAMWDKFTRASAAVACGVDLVLELPITKVLQSAEGFARGGVELLSKLGIVDILCFGAESGDVNNLMDIARKLDSGKDIFQDALSRGLSYAAARQLAAEDKDNLLSKPNNILAVEYCRALQYFNSSITPMVVQRNGNYHDQTPDSREPSATSIRACFPDRNWHQFVPQAARQHLSDASWYMLSAGERAILARLRALSDKEWESCAHGSEGLWSKAMKMSRTENSLTSIIDSVKSKRYPRTRIQRLLLCAYLGISSTVLSSPLSYARILAASEAGRTLIRAAKKASVIPLVNPGEEPRDTTYYRLEVQASDLFTLFCVPDPPHCKMEQNARLHI